MGEILKFGAKQEVMVDEPKKKRDVEEGIDTLVRYLARNFSLEVGQEILDISSVITEAAYAEGYTIGGGLLFRILDKAVKDNIISEEVHTKILGIFLELAGEEE